MLLIVGGKNDFNLQNLFKIALQKNIEVAFLMTNTDISPDIIWDLNRDKLLIKGNYIQPTSLFIRQDVFEFLETSSPEMSWSAQTWYQTLFGWVLAHPNVKTFNRDTNSYNKAYNLAKAQEANLKIPTTLITNEYNRLKELSLNSFVTKPIIGGGFCVSLEENFANADWKDKKLKAPTFIQNKLISPEYRIFIIGDKSFCFEITSNSLDYRVKQDAQVIFKEKVHEEVIEKLKILAKSLKLYFSASDFKTDAVTGELVFMEINSSPMFKAFDDVSDNAISNEIINFLSLVNN